MRGKRKLANAIAFAIGSHLLENAPAAYMRMKQSDYQTIARGAVAEVESVIILRRELETMSRRAKQRKTSKRK